MDLSLKRRGVGRGHPSPRCQISFATSTPMFDMAPHKEHDREGMLGTYAVLWRGTPDPPHVLIQNTHVHHYSVDSTQVRNQ